MGTKKDDDVLTRHREEEGGMFKSDVLQFTRKKKPQNINQAHVAEVKVLQGWDQSLQLLRLSVALSFQRRLVQVISGREQNQDS